MVFKIRLFLIVWAISLAPTHLFAQTFTVSGQVFDNKTHEPVEAVSIFLGDYPSVLTNANGEFEVKNVGKGEYEIRAQQIGYEADIAKIVVDRNLKRVHLHLEPQGVNQDTVYIVARDFLDLGPKESTLSSDYVDEEFLQKNYGNTLSQTLEKIPGISTMNTGVGIAKPVIRGMTFNRVIVNDQGVKQEGQQWGADHGLEIDQYGVERIEVVKGPSSLLYGSDGISGVINILPPAIPLEGTLSAEAVGFHRTNNAAFGGSAGVKGNFRNTFFRLRGTAQSFGDYRVPADTFLYNSYVLPIYDRALKNTAGTELDFAGTLGIQRTWGNVSVTGSHFEQRSGLFPGAIGIPRAYSLLSDGNPRNIDLPRQEVIHQKLLLNARFFLNTDWLLEVDGGMQDNSRRELSNPHNHGPGPRTRDTLAHGLDLRTFSGNMRFSQSINHHLRLKYGLTAQRQRNLREGFEFLIPHYVYASGGIYGLGEYEVGKTMTISGGLRVDGGKVQVDSFRTPIYSDSVTISGYWLRTPAIDRTFKNVSGALGWSWYGKERWNVKVNIGRAFRMPTPPELSENGVHHGTFRHEKGDPNLDPETGYQLDLGFAYHAPDLLLKATPFFNYFDNYIYLRPSGTFSPLPDAGQVYQYTQASVIHTGFEAFAEYHLIEPLHISSGAQYVWNVNMETGLPLPFTPPFSVSSQVEYSLEKVATFLPELSLSLEHVGALAQNRTDRNEKATPGYQLFHISLNGTLKAGKQTFTLNFRAQNLFNQVYMNHLSRYRILNLPEQGRNFMVTLRIPIEIVK